MLVNLISNAFKFSETGTIKVKAELRNKQTASESDNDPYLLLSVSVEGAGIPADKMNVLFQRFTQVNSSISRERCGSGLGLAICKGIVEKMTGEIWAESKEGIGSNFIFTLPCRYFYNNLSIASISATIII